MENLPRDLPKEVTSFTFPKPSKRIMRWNLLLVRDHGKIVVIRRLKLWAFLCFIMLAVPAVSAVSFLYLYKHSIEKNEFMQKELSEVRLKYKELRDEKDILTAQLVVTESNSKNGIEGLKINDSNDTAAKGDKTNGNVKTSTQEANDDLEIMKDTMEEGAVLDDESQPVTVRSLIVSHNGKDTFTVAFRLRNSTPETDPVSGYAFVFLKNETLQKDKWLILPDVDLKDEKPVSIKKGHSFSIERFKPVSFSRVSKTDPKLYTKATIIVYNKKQELVYNKTFPITVKVGE